ncbi:hypothetical protein [Aliamphritea spongicola]|uniref:hypothetical protein n=1 Tax=Aliamphritea spongicola TaxID=707589 RepID=UPI00196ABF15|nr:hypothetical protein [Aliamphritea spongicola]MBN3563543.1 hypothetical protein [Aliamphritea spongicola]
MLPLAGRLMLFGWFVSMSRADQKMAEWSLLKPAVLVCQRADLQRLAELVGAVARYCLLLQVAAELSVDLLSAERLTARQGARYFVQAL